MNDNKEQGWCPGEMLTPHLGKGKWHQLHCRAELAAATGEVTLKMWKLGLRSLRGGNKNHGAPTMVQKQVSLVGLYRASSEGRGGNKIHLGRRIISLETGSGHKHLWVCGCPFPASGTKLNSALRCSGWSDAHEKY